MFSFGGCLVDQRDGMILSCNQTLCHMENHHFSKTVNHLHTWPIFQSYLRLPEGFMSIPPSGALTLPNHVGLAGSPRSCLHWFTNEHEHSNPVLICQLCMEQKQLTIPSLPQIHKKNRVPGLYSICSNQNLLNGEHCQKSCKRQPSVAVPKISAVKKS